MISIENKYISVYQNDKTLLVITIDMFKYNTIAEFAADVEIIRLEIIKHIEDNDIPLEQENLNTLKTCTIEDTDNFDFTQLDLIINICETYVSEYVKLNIVTFLPV